MNPTAPANATKTVAGISEADMIKEAWGFDSSLDLLFYVILGISYGASLIPSIFGVLVISQTRWVMIYYLLYDCVVRFLDIDKKPKDQSKIWNITNWALYSLRRVVLEFLINNLNAFTQIIPFTNMVLNLIPTALTYVNIFVL